MIIEDITRDDVITVLEHVQATCALNDDYCQSCPYAGHNTECVLLHIPQEWRLEQIGGDADDPGE